MKKNSDKVSNLANLAKLINCVTFLSVREAKLQPESNPMLT